MASNQWWVARGSMPHLGGTACVCAQEQVQRTHTARMLQLAPGVPLRQHAEAKLAQAIRDRALLDVPIACFRRRMRS